MRACAVAVILVAPVLAFGATTAGAALPPRLSEGQAKRIFLADAKVASWLRHYPRSTWVTTAALRSSDRRWQVHVFSGAAGEVATGLVDDTSGAVLEAWTGPQVAWPLARGPGLGGVINHADIWLVFCAVFLLALFAGLSIWEMSGDSLTPDERAHLPAGYAYWVAGEFRLNPEHPPFVKLLCAAPLLFMDLKIPPTQPPAGVTFHNYIARFGTAFLSQDLDRILFWGRLPVVGLGVLLGFLVFSWSRRIHGQAGAGLISIFLLALEPTLLAHSHFITTDVALACFTIMAFSFLWRFCEAGGDGRHLVLAVAGMGLALASKFSAVVLLPLFFTLWLRRWPVRAPAAGDRRPVADRLLASRGLAAAAALLGIAIIIQACYFFSPDLSLYFKGLEAVRANKPVNYPAYAAGTFFVGGRWWYALYVFFRTNRSPGFIAISGHGSAPGVPSTACTGQSTKSGSSGACVSQT